MSTQITAPVFNIQTYCIHDGPGIRTTVFLKGCPLRCLWCANPESNEIYPQLLTYQSLCTSCGKCIPSCPHQAIQMTVSGDMPPIVTTDRALCKNCGACIKSCPQKAREIAGDYKTPDDVLKLVLKNKLFLTSSGGGMTLSGGELLLHPVFSEELLKKAQESGLHTAVESCCFAKKETIDRVFAYVNLGLLDIKHMNSKIHEKLTGVPNEIILENICHIYHELNVPVIIRIPIVPGFNDDEENIHKTASFVKEKLGTDVPVHLLPYHNMGTSKAENLGQIPELSISVPKQDHMEHLMKIVESYGLKTQIGG